MGPDVTHSNTCVDLTDVTLADKDTKSILTDNANRAIKVNVTMHVDATWWLNICKCPDDLKLNKCKWGNV